MTRKIQIFLGGGVKLLHGENEALKGYRNDVVDPLISQLNSEEFARYLFITKDYSDLTRNVVSGKHQDVYNRYIEREAQIALFILDGKIGNITKQEIDVAVASTKKSHHPIVYIYGINIQDEEILEYLNQKGIYFQHFYDNRDLAAKIKTDIYASLKLIERRRNWRIGASVALTLMLCGSLLLLAKNIIPADNGNAIDDCTMQLYLMRYKDVNVLAQQPIFTDSLLSQFHYEDSLMEGSDVSVFPIFGSNSVTTTPPFFRLKIHNKNKNTIVFISAELEIDQYTANDGLGKTFSALPIHDSELHQIDISGDKSNYSLNGFRQSIAYGETDDRYFYYLTAPKPCTFRMRAKAKSQNGDYLYSNYVYVNYLQPQQIVEAPEISEPQVNTQTQPNTQQAQTTEVVVHTETPKPQGDDLYGVPPAPVYEHHIVCKPEPEFGKDDMCMSGLEMIGYLISYTIDEYGTYTLTIQDPKTRVRSTVYLDNDGFSNADWSWISHVLIEGNKLRIKHTICGSGGFMDAYCLETLPRN